ncbi:MAG: PilT/PilU family type 4a pilus ATPase [candidate division Zixibacteria bacterium]
MINLRELLEQMVKAGASDLHLTVGAPPVIRVDGKLVRMQMDFLTAEVIKKLAYSMLNEKQKTKFEQNNELDFSFGIESMSRFRANMYMQRGNIAVALRQIPYKIMTFDELALPKVMEEFAVLPRGLILITGPTGSGKSTTLAAVIDKINKERPVHIITVEDPIEYLHRHQMALINQREVYSDTPSFASALKYALREDPDVVLVGEMRDLETIESALAIAETGHLAFATLHTNSCAESINRIVDVFPTNQQEQVRVALSFSLQAVVSQSLIPKIGGGRCMALEIMVATPAIRAIIRDDKIHQLYSMIQSGQKFGMKTMNQSLAELFTGGKITINDAMAYSGNPQELSEMLSRNKAPAY